MISTSVAQGASDLSKNVSARLSSTTPEQIQFAEERKGGNGSGGSGQDPGPPPKGDSFSERLPKPTDRQEEPKPKSDLEDGAK